MSKKRIVKSYVKAPQYVAVDHGKKTQWLSLGVLLVIMLGVIAVNNSQSEASFSTPGTGLSLFSTSRVFSYTSKDATEKLVFTYPRNLKIENTDDSGTTFSLFPISYKDIKHTQADFTVALDDHDSASRKATSPDQYEAQLKSFPSTKTLTGFSSKNFGSNAVYYFNEENSQDKDVQVAHIFKDNHQITLLYNVGKSRIDKSFTKAEAERIISSISLTK